MNLRLARLESNEEATRGVLYVHGRIRLATLEDPWKGNKQNVSCIPTGHYTCKRGKFPKNGETFQVMNVPGRDAILFHVANTSDDVTGCIGLGLGFSDRGDRLEIHSSQLAMKRFLQILSGIDSFTIDIVDLCFTPLKLEGPKIL